jgi:hypothetical protein
MKREAAGKLVVYLGAPQAEGPIARSGDVGGSASRPKLEGKKRGDGAAVPCRVGRDLRFHYRPYQRGWLPHQQAARAVGPPFSACPGE